jgi:hypothetical protein
MLPALPKTLSVLLVLGMFQAFPSSARADFVSTADLLTPQIAPIHGVSFIQLGLAVLDSTPKPSYPAISWVSSNDDDPCDSAQGAQRLPGGPVARVHERPSRPNHALWSDPPSFGDRVVRLLERLSAVCLLLPIELSVFRPPRVS